MSYARRHSTNVCPGNRVRYIKKKAPPRGRPWTIHDLAVATVPAAADTGTLALGSRRVGSYVTLGADQTHPTDVPASHHSGTAWRWSLLFNRRFARVHPSPRLAIAPMAVRTIKPVISANSMRPCPRSSRTRRRNQIILGPFVVRSLARPSITKLQEPNSAPAGHQTPNCAGQEQEVALGSGFRSRSGGLCPELLRTAVRHCRPGAEDYGRICASWAVGSVPGTCAMFHRPPPKKICKVAYVSRYLSGGVSAGQSSDARPKVAEVCR